MCHHKAPHREWVPALRHLGHDNDRPYPEPPTLFDDYSGRGKAEHDQDMTIASTMNDDDLKLTPPTILTPEQRRAWDAYYEPRNAAFRKPRHCRATTWCAGNTSATCTIISAASRPSTRASAGCSKYLDEEGLAENTIVVYSSDQGFYLGEHGWFDKRWIFEESLRTPLLVRWPGVVKPAAASAAASSRTSISPRPSSMRPACRFPPDMQGPKPRSRLARARRRADWRKSFYYQYYEYPAPHHVRPHYGVVTDRYKLVRFDGPDVDLWELFDRQKDPHELKSVYRDPAYASVVADLKRELDRLRKELKVPPFPPREAAGQSKAVPAKK